MNDLLPFIVVGITAGSLYGLAAMGLVLTYKTSGVLNFAHGALAAAGAYAFYELHIERGAPWPVALVLSVGVVALVGGTAIERLSRNLAAASPVLSIATTVGMFLGIQGVLYWRFGFDTRKFPEFVRGQAFTLQSVDVSRQALLAVAIAGISAAALFIVLRRSRIGASMRAVVDDPTLLDLTGTSPVRVRQFAWVIGSGFAALSGILIAPSLGLDATLLTLLVLQAFGAAAIGRFTNLALTYFGGIVLGVAAAVLTKYVAGTPELSGVPSNLPFFVLFVVLLLAPPRTFGGSRRRSRTAERFVIPAKFRLPLALATAATVVAIPHLVGARLPVYNNGAIFVMLFVSLGALVWTSGQISLCHAAFVALGASTFAHLTTGAGLPWFLALLCSGLAVVPLGALVAVPAVRLSGVYLALATFGFGLVAERVFYGTGFMFGSLDLVAGPRPSFARGDTAFFYLVVALAAASCVAMAIVLRTRLGRLLRALADSPIALTTNGLGVNVTRLLIFSLSAFLAGVSGALFLAVAGRSSGRGFPALNSLLWLTVLVVCGSRAIMSPVIAAFLLAVVPAYLPSELIRHQAMIFGVLATVAAIGSGIGRREVGFVARRSARSPVRARTRERVLEGMVATPAFLRARAVLPVPQEVEP